MKLNYLIPFVAALIAACSSEPKCDYSKAPYQTAASVAPLRAPEGLTAPDHSAALVIPPESKTNVAPLGKGKCLDRPPSYFATAQQKPEDKPDSKSDSKTDKNSKKKTDKKSEK
ncbi:MAG TPA: hypothetical protein VET48_10250 [Steroidobacteraceae bacterium]|nr:hypothetical protein [Steroidobacteraceae bacterium]